MGSREIPIKLPASGFKGLILNPSQIDVDFNAATLCSNVEKAENSQLTIRKGMHHAFRKEQLQDFHNLFPFTYTYHDTEDGSTVEELLALHYSMDDAYTYFPVTLLKLIEQTFSISYVGSGVGRIQLYPEFEVPIQPNFSSVWRLILTANNVEVLNTLLGTEEASSMVGLRTLQGVITAIHALTDFTCTPSSLPASAQQTAVDVIGPFIDQSLNNGESASYEYYDIEEIGAGEGSAFSNYFNNANFALPSALNYSNVLYFAYGTFEYKYDGQSFYASGVPEGNLLVAQTAAGGSTFTAGDTYIYKIVYARVDARGNIAEGADSDDTLSTATVTLLATRDIDVFIKPVHEAYVDKSVSSYNVKGAKVNGLQTGVNTITVDTGHTIEEGDTLYFYDGVTSDYVTRLVTGTAATTITFAGDAVDVADNIYISNNVIIQIWRTKNEGVDFYLVDEIPNQFDAVTQIQYVDQVPDSSLIIPFVEQLRKHDFPPKTNCLLEHQGLKVSLCDPDNPNRIRWALPNMPEGYPLASNVTDIKGGGLGALTGAGVVDDNVLAVFKRTGHVLLDGVLDDIDFRTLNRANTGIGCTSFRTIQNIGENDVLIGLSLRGPFVFNGRSPTLLVSQNIAPLFAKDKVALLQVNGVGFQTDTSTDLNTFVAPINVNLLRSLERAVGFNDYLRKKYHLFVPAEIGTPGEYKSCVYTSCKWLVYDYDPLHMFWSEVTSYARYRTLTIGTPHQSPICNSGLTMYKNKVWYGMCSARSDGTAVADLQLRATLGNFKDGNTIYDYSDNAYPVYLDLFYIPITRDPGSVTAFFKPLWILFERFLSDSTSDPAIIETSPSFDPNFTLVIKSILNNQQYNGNPYSSFIAKTFKALAGRIMLRSKLVSNKARSLQIQITNENADPAAFEKPAFDNIEVIYCTPYDPKSKETKG